MNQKLCLLVLAATLAACSTTPIAPQEAKPVPADRIKAMQPVADGVKVMFIRDTGYMGAIYYDHLYVDGTEVAALDTGEKVEFLIAPGDHIFGVRPTDPFGATTMRSIDAYIRTGVLYEYRVLSDSSGNAMLQRVMTNKQ